MGEIRLPDIPTGLEFEDFIAAHLQVADHFVERNLSMRTEQPILELDIIATKYDTGRPTPLLVEAKSRDWEYKDIFKVRGWMDLLGIERGVFAVHQRKSHFDVWYRVAKELNIDLIAIEEFGSASSVLS